ncbi:aa3-type cytochrome oxidase subunit CtaJ [Jidongwangia harbinensis]|uniref:aa3-type cytochrome oxidase subunit CtaJ n=1 Tax=Jidongwangia harbinensis TaxID=2878561 RepID=UPI003FD7E05B
MIIPVAVAAVIAALSFAGSDSRRRTRRYRPGRPYDFQPVWFLASPEQVSSAAGALTAGGRAQPPAIESGIIEDASGRPVRPGSTGGASDRW